MNVMSLLQNAAAPQGSLLSMIFPIALIFVIFYFFIIRPQNKKQKETQKMIDALKKGDKIVTIGGIHGVISSTKEQSVIVKVDENAKIEFSRSAIATVIADKSEKTEKNDKAASQTESGKESEKKPLFGFGKSKKNDETSSSDTDTSKN